jgi:hypothetical protein
MNRKSVVASFGLVACLAAALSAQAPFSDGKVDQPAVQSIRAKVIGCVAGDAANRRPNTTQYRGDHLSRLRRSRQCVRVDCLASRRPSSLQHL